MSDRVVLIDGSALIFRAYFAIPGTFRTSAGLPTNAVFGFTNMFRKLMSGKWPRYGAVVFDAPGKTFRAEKFPDYKANRSAMPDDLREQLPWIDKVVEAHRFPMLRVAGYEADDVIGTLAKAGREAGHEVVIVSSDKDFAQLIDEHVKMFDAMKDVTYDAELVRKKWGVPPERFVDFLALTGDSSDNVPGVPGIGKKGAAELLETYGSLDALLENVDQLKGRKKTTLTENRALALLSRELVQIETAVPLETGLPELELPAPPDDLNELYRELEFYSLLTDEAREASAEVEGERDYATVKDPQALSAYLNAAEGPVFWLPCVEGAGDEARRVTALMCSNAAGSARYLPLAGPHAHPELAGQGLEGSPAWEPLRAYLADEGRPKVVHDAKALWVGLARLGVELKGVTFDTRLASFLIDPTKLIPHRLDQLVKEFLHRTVRDDKGVVGRGKKQKVWSKAPLAAASEHACHLVDALAELSPLLEAQLEEAGYRELHDTHDLPLSYVLGGMELRGILVDPADLNALGVEFHAELAGYEERIHAHAGHAFNINSTKQLGTVLFDELGLPVIKKTKTGYSTNQSVLERLKPQHPIAAELLEYRKLAKLINTYTDVLQRAADPETCRIHTVFQQTSGATGRLITTDPDLQRTPIRGKRGARIRRCFTAPPDHCVISADWSQIELRLMADASADPVLVGAFREARDVHALTASELFDCKPEDVTPKQRRVGKTVNFATIYGQGATALSQILEIPRKQAKAYIDEFFATYQGVKEWIERTTADALERGFVTTRLGRRRTIPELQSNNKMIRQAGLRIAANTPLQGSGADICKLAMLELDRRLLAEGLRARMVLQIHDELLFQSPLDEAERVCALAKEVMETVIELKVPLVADVGTGKSWAEAH